MTPPGLYVESVSSFSREDAIVNLLFIQTLFRWALRGTIERSVLMQQSLVSVNPIMDGSRSAALLNRSLRSARFDGRPLMFCNMIRSRCGGHGVVGWGPHVVVIEGLPSLLICSGGGSGFLFGSSFGSSVVSLLFVRCAGDWFSVGSGFLFGSSSGSSSGSLAVSLLRAGGCSFENSFGISVEVISLVLKLGFPAWLCGALKIRSDRFASWRVFGLTSLAVVRIAGVWTVIGVMLRLCVISVGW